MQQHITNVQVTMMSPIEVEQLNMQSVTNNMEAATTLNDRMQMQLHAENADHFACMMQIVSCAYPP